METPDTTEAVANALHNIGVGEPLTDKAAKAAIQAHNKAMAEGVPEMNHQPGQSQYQEGLVDGYNRALRLFFGAQA